ncbi:MAG TPA: hypothetical protein DIU15_14875 [Deltaproteobacteria bacterium]|nr:hypothetical protein [Deltaproteobacteria bacterium]HCP47323.1 hypothetical protein [Deltaproteobacteria bacterium]
MTVPQDTVLCLGLGVAAHLASPGPAPLRMDQQRVATSGFAVAWVPLTTVLLVGWPDWSWWYWEFLAGRPGLALVLGLVLEVGAFMLGLRWARSVGPPSITKALVALGVLYAALVVLPFQHYKMVGTAAEVASGAGTPLWRSPGLALALGLGGAWFAAFGVVTVLRIRKLAAVVLILLAVPMTACSGISGKGGEVVVSSEQDENPANRPLMLAVTRDAEPVVRAWARRLAEQMGTPMPRLRVVEGVSSMHALAEGEVAAAFLHRKPSDHEVRYAEGEGLFLNSKLKALAMARSALVLLVHSSNPVQVVSQDQARGILDGTVGHWRGLGGSDDPIHLFVARRMDGTPRIVRERLLNGAALSVHAQEVPADEAVASAVASDPLAVGLSSGAFVHGTRVLTIRDEEGLQRPHLSDPSDSTKGPLTRELFLVTQGTPDLRVAELRQFAQSLEGRAVAEMFGYLVSDMEDDRVP